MKYLQSFYQYPVTFSSIGKTIPARSAVGDMKNLAEVTEAELEKLQNREPFFRELVEKKKLRVLTHMPESYKTSAARINEANDEIARLKAENERLRAQQKAPAAEETISDGATTDDVDSTDPTPAEGLTDEDRKKQYEEMTYAELQDACKYAGIEYKNKKKAELIQALKDFTDQ